MVSSYEFRIFMVNRVCTRYSQNVSGLTALHKNYFKKKKKKKKKKKVREGVPQSQNAALPRYQEEEKTVKSKQTQIEQTYEKH